MSACILALSQKGLSPDEELGEPAIFSFPSPTISEILRWEQMRLQHKTPDDCICLRMLALQRQTGAECFA